MTRSCLSLAGPAALLGVGGAARLWLWRAPGDAVRVLAVAGALALASLVGLVWEGRARAARRRHAALDASAAREIVRASRRQGGPGLPRLYPRGGRT
jgi:hypothetical protein